VKWFRERAERDRFQEEVQILEAEFERTITSHGRMAEVWSELASRCSESKPGAAAYAHKKVGMYHQLQCDCKLAYKTALEKATIANNDSESAA
jgi:hypothetical protein